MRNKVFFLGIMAIFAFLLPESADGFNSKGSEHTGQRLYYIFAGHLDRWKKDLKNTGTVSVKEWELLQRRASRISRQLRLYRLIENTVWREVSAEGFLSSEGLLIMKIKLVSSSPLKGWLSLPFNFSNIELFSPIDKKKSVVFQKNSGTVIVKNSDQMGSFSSLGYTSYLQLAALSPPVKVSLSREGGGKKGFAELRYQFRLPPASIYRVNLKFPKGYEIYSQTKTLYIHRTNQFVALKGSIPYGGLVEFTLRPKKVGDRGGLLLAQADFFYRLTSNIYRLKAKFKIVTSGVSRFSIPVEEDFQLTDVELPKGVQLSLERGREYNFYLGENLERVTFQIEGFLKPEKTGGKRLKLRPFFIRNAYYQGGKLSVTFAGDIEYSLERKRGAQLIGAESLQRMGEERRLTFAYWSDGAEVDLSIKPQKPVILGKFRYEYRVGKNLFAHLTLRAEMSIVRGSTSKVVAKIPKGWRLKSISIDKNEQFSYSWEGGEIFIRLKESWRKGAVHRLTLQLTRSLRQSDEEEKKNRYAKLPLQPIEFESIEQTKAYLFISYPSHYSAALKNSKYLEEIRAGKSIRGELDSRGGTPNRSQSENAAPNDSSRRYHRSQRSQKSLLKRKKALTYSTERADFSGELEFKRWPPKVTCRELLTYNFKALSIDQRIAADGAIDLYCRVHFAPIREFRLSAINLPSKVSVQLSSPNLSKDSTNIVKKSGKTPSEKYFLIQIKGELFGPFRLRIRFQVGKGRYIREKLPLAFINSLEGKIVEKFLAIKERERISAALEGECPSADPLSLPNAEDSSETAQISRAYRITGRKGCRESKLTLKVKRIILIKPYKFQVKLGVRALQLKDGYFWVTALFSIKREEGEEFKFSLPKGAELLGIAKGTPQNSWRRYNNWKDSDQIIESFVQNWEGLHLEGIKPLMAIERGEQYIVPIRKDEPVAFIAVYYRTKGERERKLGATEYSVPLPKPSGSSRIVKTLWKIELPREEMLLSYQTTPPFEKIAIPKAEAALANFVKSGRVLILFVAFFMLWGVWKWIARVTISAVLSIFSLLIGGQGIISRIFRAFIKLSISIVVIAVLALAVLFLFGGCQKRAKMAQREERAVGFETKTKRKADTAERKKYKLFRKEKRSGRRETDEMKSAPPSISQSRSSESRPEEFYMEPPPEKFSMEPPPEEFPMESSPMSRTSREPELPQKSPDFDSRSGRGKRTERVRKYRYRVFKIEKRSPLRQRTNRARARSFQEGRKTRQFLAGAKALGVHSITLQLPRENVWTAEGETLGFPERLQFTTLSYSLFQLAMLLTLLLSSLVWWLLARRRNVLLSLAALVLFGTLSHLLQGSFVGIANAGTLGILIGTAAVVLPGSRDKKPSESPPAASLALLLLFALPSLLSPSPVSAGPPENYGNFGAIKKVRKNIYLPRQRTNIRRRPNLRKFRKLNIPSQLTGNIGKRPNLRKFRKLNIPSQLTGNIGKVPALRKSKGGVPGVVRIKAGGLSPVKTGGVEGKTALYSSKGEFCRALLRGEVSLKFRGYRPFSISKGEFSPWDAVFVPLRLLYLSQTKTLEECLAPLRTVTYWSQSVYYLKITSQTVRGTVQIRIYPRNKGKLLLPFNLKGVTLTDVKILPAVGYELGFGKNGYFAVVESSGREEELVLTFKFATPKLLGSRSLKLGLIKSPFRVVFVSFPGKEWELKGLPPQRDLCRNIRAKEQSLISFLEKALLKNSLQNSSPCELHGDKEKTQAFVPPVDRDYIVLRWGRFQRKGPVQLEFPSVKAEFSATLDRRFAKFKANYSVESKYSSLTELQIPLEENISVGKITGSKIENWKISENKIVISLQSYTKKVSFSIDYYLRGEFGKRAFDLPLLLPENRGKTEGSLKLTYPEYLSAKLVQSKFVNFVGQQKWRGEITERYRFDRTPGIKVKLQERRPTGTAEYRLSYLFDRSELKLRAELILRKSRWGRLFLNFRSGIPLSERDIRVERGSPIFQVKSRKEKRGGFKVAVELVRPWAEGQKLSIELAIPHSRSGKVPLLLPELPIPWEGEVKLAAREKLPLEVDERELNRKFLPLPIEGGLTFERGGSSWRWLYRFALPPRDRGELSFAIKPFEVKTRRSRRELKVYAALFCTEEEKQLRAVVRQSSAPSGEVALIIPLQLYQNFESYILREGKRERAKVKAEILQGERVKISWNPPRGRELKELEFRSVWRDSHSCSVGTIEAPDTDDVSVSVGIITRREFLKDKRRLRFQNLELLPDKKRLQFYRRWGRNFGGTIPLPQLFLKGGNRWSLRFPFWYIEKQRSFKPTVDLAIAETSISGNGWTTFTKLRLYLRSYGLSHLSFKRPPDSQLVEISVNGKSTGITFKNNSSLIPLPPYKLGDLPHFVSISFIQSHYFNSALNSIKLNLPKIENLTISQIFWVVNLPPEVTVISEEGDFSPTSPFQLFQSQLDYAFNLQKQLKKLSEEEKGGAQLRAAQNISHQLKRLKNILKESEEYIYKYPRKKDRFIRSLSYRINIAKKEYRKTYREFQSKSWESSYNIRKKLIKDSGEADKLILPESGSYVFYSSGQGETLILQLLRKDRAIRYAGWPIWLLLLLAFALALFKRKN